MKVRIYNGTGREKIFDRVNYIEHVNAVKGLVIHEPLAFAPKRGLDIQAQLGQSFVLSTVGFLGCFECGHEILCDGDQIVFAAEP